MTLCKGIVLLFLGLFCKVSVAAENSTQVYFFELEIESTAYNETYLSTLSPLNCANWTVSDIIVTANCTVGENSYSTQKNCSCTNEHRWSSDICETHKCCKNENCTLNVIDDAVCLPINTVIINGSTTFPSLNYGDLYDQNNKQTEKYDEIIKNITNELKSNFSTLPWFDSLVITGFRKGSLIVDYTVQVLSFFNINQLQNITGNLQSKLIIKGLVTINIANQQPVDIGTTATVTCTKQDDLGAVTWSLTNAQNKTTVITNGTEASLSSNNLSDTVTLSNISAVWKGLFTCEYTKWSIKLTASEPLDIALLPDIQGSSDPQFPDCTDQNQNVHVVIQCAILNNSENYTVSWNSSANLYDLTQQQTEYKEDKIYYKAEATIKCGDGNESLSTTCTFRNIRSQTKKNSSMTVDIPIIKSNSSFCVKQDDWPKTKGNYTAVLPCDNAAVGNRIKKCNNTIWQEEISNCVDPNLNKLYNDILKIGKGLGFIIENADSFFKRLQISTTFESIKAFANIDATVQILESMNSVSEVQSHQWNDTIVPDFVSAISNILNDTKYWKQTSNDNATSLSIKYLQSVENMMNNSNLSPTSSVNRSNVALKVCNSSDCNFFNVSVKTEQNVTVVVVAFRKLATNLPQTLNNKSVESEGIILSVTEVNGTDSTYLKMNFSDGQIRKHNHQMFCVYWDENQKEWSSDGCTWGGANNPTLCTCTHNSAFTIMMSKTAESLPYMEELTYVGLGISVVSLVLCILIEIMVWDTVVKSNISNFRHIALVNISVCLLFAYCAFLASAKPEQILPNWCMILTVVKQFCFLAAFFWMLCLSFVLLHQLIFVFEKLRKRVYLALSITVGYACPLLCVAVTVIQFGNGMEGEYFSKDTCWLVYQSTLKGSLFAFILPVGTVVVLNMFALFVVITKIATPTVSEAKARDEKDVAKSIIKTIVLLSPILGITWILGFFVFTLDLTQKPYAQIVNYAFTILNSLQGFFILFSNCFGEKKVREALLKRFRAKKSVNFTSESSTKVTSLVKK
ncbi:adhesion G-protein coupled receptor F1-like isoform X2 [Paramisgurnus dabryanus]|uniref:adhesion G-protein coupled receptor F1-like isoform X2 n=1 Tax=Paramisgurnus dabryanus TaxID=90735 RepID=UPI0031F34768